MLWRQQSPVELARAFVDACNQRDTATLADILHPDFEFHDSWGSVLQGRETMLRALARVNEIAPDLRVEIDRASRRGNSALLSGRSLTAHPGLACDTQWRALVEEGKLIEWQAYGRPSGISLAGLLKTVDMEVVDQAPAKAR